MSINNINEFETLLRQRNSDDRQHIIERVDPEIPERLVADRNASIDDFIVMLSTIVSKVMKKQKVEFKPDEGIRLSADQAEELNHPYIMFRILDAQPKMEIKPRIREVGLKGLDNQQREVRRSGEIWGQMFGCVIQFDILAGGYKEATQVMNDFEDTIFTYTAYFKRNGVKDIRFTRRLTDSNLDMYRQKCSVRSLQYSVEIEKLFARFDTEIEGINVR